MARPKQPNLKAEPAAEQENAGPAELDVLYPERKLEVAGREVTVREYGFLQGLKLRKLYSPMVTALAECMQQPGAPVSQVAGILAENADAVVQLMAEATGLDTDVIEQLSGTEGNALMTAWWACNCDFFLRQATEKLINDKLAEAARVGVMSSRPSLKTDTAQSASSTTPSDK